MAGLIRHQIEAEHQRQIVLDAPDRRADLRAHDESVTGRATRRQRLQAGDRIEIGHQLGVPFVAAGRQHDAFSRRQHGAVGHPHAGDPVALDGQIANRGAEADRHAARQQRLHEVSDEADALAAHVLVAALAHQILIPGGIAVDPAPGILLLGGDEIGRVLRRSHLVAPGAELETGDQLRFERASRPARAGCHAQIVIDDAAHHPERDAAGFVVGEHIRRAIDQRQHAILGQFAAAEKRHVADDVLARIDLAGSPHQMIAADPDQPVGIRRGAADQIRLFDQQRAQPVLVRRQCRGETGNARTQHDDVKCLGCWRHR